MGIRKLLDLIFTQTELYWLDHMLPGEDRIKIDDEQVSDITVDLFIVSTYRVVCCLSCRMRMLLVSPHNHPTSVSS